MILKNQFAELIYPKVYNLDSIYESIETAARISYKSESKGDSKKFVENLIKSGHYSPLEFGTVYLYADCTNCDDLDMLRDKYYNNVYSRSRSYFNYPCEYITTNMRVLQENGWLDDLKYLCTSSTFHKKRYTLHCVTSYSTPLVYPLIGLSPL